MTLDRSRNVPRLRCAQELPSEYTDTALVEFGKVMIQACRFPKSTRLFSDP